MTEAERERAEIVAWLKSEEAGWIANTYPAYMKEIADAIEALAHKDAGNG